MIQTPELNSSTSYERAGSSSRFSEVAMDDADVLPPDSAISFQSTDRFRPALEMAMHDEAIFQFPDGAILEQEVRSSLRDQSLAVTEQTMVQLPDSAISSFHSTDSSSPDPNIGNEFQIRSLNSAITQTTDPSLLESNSAMGAENDQTSELHSAINASDINQQQNRMSVPLKDVNDHMLQEAVDPGKQISKSGANKGQNVEEKNDGVEKNITDNTVQPNRVKKIDTVRMCNISPNLVVVLDDLPPIFKQQAGRVRKLLVAASCPESFLQVPFERSPETRRLLVIQLPDPDTIIKLLALDGAVIAGSSVSVRLWQESDLDRFNPCALQNYQPEPPRALDDVNKALALITNEIESHFANCQPRPATVQNRVNLMKQFVEWLKVLQTHLDSESEPVEIFLELFGSVPSLTSTESSDLDVSFWSKLPLKTDKEELLKCWFQLLRKQQRSTGVSFFVHGARVPVVKYYSVLDKIEVDFTFKDDIGRQRLKSTMVAACVKKDIRVAKLINGIKFWSKRRFIGDASMGSLNSFGHTLLVLHYLQCGCSPPVLPNIFEMAFGDQPIIATHDSRDPFQNDAFTNWTTSNMDSLGQLLLGYFHYYGTQWDSLNQMVSLRRACFVPLPKTKDERSLLFHPNHHAHLCIEDPFDSKDNIARNVSQSIGKRIVREFRRGLDMLGQCVSWAELTEDVTRQSNKPWHNFGKFAQQSVQGQQRKPNDRRRAQPKQSGRFRNGSPVKNVRQPERVNKHAQNLGRFDEIVDPKGHSDDSGLNPAATMQDKTRNFDRSGSKSQTNRPDQKKRLHRTATSLNGVDTESVSEPSSEKDPQLSRCDFNFNPKASLQSSYKKFSVSRPQSSAQSNTKVQEFVSYTTVDTPQVAASRSNASNSKPTNAASTVVNPSPPNDRSLRISNSKLNRKSSRPDKHAGSKSNAILPQPSSAPACAISGITQSASLLSLIPVSSVPPSENPPKPRKSSRHNWRRGKESSKSSGATINGHGNTATSNAGLVHAWSEAHSSPP